MSDELEQTAGAPLAPELDAYRRQFEALKSEADALLAGLTDAEFNWRPAPGRWSVAECLAHLNVTGQIYLNLLAREIKRARAAGLVSTGTYRHGLLGRLFIRAMEPPARLKLKAPKLYEPLPEHLLAVVAPAFATLQEQFIARLREADGLDLRRVKVSSPASRLLRLSLGETFALMAAHERRHLWQARGVRDSRR